MITKRIGTGIAALLALVVLTAGALTLASCFNPLAKEETLGRFVIGGSSARAYFDKTSDADIAQLTLDITVSDGPGPEQHKTGTGSEGVPFTVNPGTWTITVRAYFNDNFAAYGSTTMNISAGDNNVVVDMHTFEAGLYQIKGAEYVYVPDVVSNDVASAVSYIHGNPGTYILFMQNPPASPLDPIGPQTLDTGEHLTLMGITGEGVTTATAIQSSGGTLFTVSNGASLTLDDNIILSGATNSAVRVDTGGTFTMRGGTISGNTSNKGGGVYVASGGRFSKTGGTISGNNATDGTSNGHSVYVLAPRRFYDSTAGTDVDLDSTTDANWESAPIVNAILPALTAIPPVNCPLNSQQSLTVFVSNSSLIETQGGTLTYQWYRNTANSNVGGTAIGATLASYSPSTTSAGTFYYYVTVTNTITDNGDGGTKTISATSNVVTVTVTNGSPPTAAGFYRIDGGTNYIEIDLTLSNNIMGAVNHINFNPAASYLMLIDPTVNISVTNQYNLTKGSLILKGVDSMRTLHLAETVTTSMFIIGGGSETASLTLENNITLLGHADNGEALVTVATNGTFTMEGNSAIKSNTSDGSGNAPGGGVYVDGGSFTMKDDSLIDNNQAEWSGGGVYVDGGSFDMQGGTISNNMAFSRDGGGVHVNSGTFTMLDGTISGNEAGLYGGGVYVNGAAVNGGVFTKTPMAGPVINGGTGTNPNRASADENGHAVYVENGPYDGYYRDILAASGNEIDTSGGTGLLPP